MKNNIKVLENPKKGDEIKKFWFFDKTNAGVPKLRLIQSGKGNVEIIEVSNVGRSYKEGHLKSVRITIKTEDNEIKFKTYKDVWYFLSDATMSAYNDLTNNFLRKLSTLKRNVIRFEDASYDIIGENSDIIQKLIDRREKLLKAEIS